MVVTAEHAEAEGLRVGDVWLCVVEVGGGGVDIGICLCFCSGWRWCEHIGV